jgi:hypothetical protein
MKTTLFILCACFFLSCEKSLENVTEDPASKMSVRDLGIVFNRSYTVQEVPTGPGTLTDPVTVKFISDTQVAESQSGLDPMVNDYRITGRGSISANAIRMQFAALAPRCEFGNCPVVVNDCQNVELYRDGNTLTLVKHYSARDRIYRLIE